MPPRRFLPAGAALLLATGLAQSVATTSPAYAAASGGPAAIVVRDGATQPVFDYANRIVEDVYVEVPIDSDDDGQPDRVHLAITRPGETASAGLKVGSLIVPSPYGGGILEDPYPSVDVDHLPQETGPSAFASRASTASAQASSSQAQQRQADDDDPLDLWHYYTTRGYAMIGMDSLGTNLSTGCPDSGGPNETAAMRAVVNWLGGQGRAFDAAGNQVSATWSAKAVGMYGVSYNGTLPIAAAVTGVPGLKTIIPMSAVTNWYDEYRANGLVVAPQNFQGEDVDMMARVVLTRQHPEVCAAAMDRLTQEQDRTTGDYSPFWAQRNYTAKAGNMKASVFMVHGLQDWNVKSKQFAQFWDALGKAGVPRKLWLYDGDHGSTTNPVFLTAMHGWIDHYIYGVNSGVDREPPVSLESADWTTVTTAPAWPDQAAKPVALRLAPGSLSATSAATATESFTDNGNTVRAEELVANPDQASPNRLAYVTPALRQSARLSGTPRVTADISIDNRTAANVTALLVDYGPTGTDPVIVTRGWIDPQNRDSIAVSSPVLPGEVYRLRWDQQPKEHTFAAGHRIGLVMISTDYDYTLRPAAGTQLSVRTGGSALELPIVGGAAALRF